MGTYVFECLILDGMRARESRQRCVVVIWWCTFFFFFSSRRRHTRLQGDWSSDVCSSDLVVRSRWLARAASRARGWIANRIDRGNVGAIEEVEGVSDEIELEAFAERNEIGRASCRERV